MAYLFSTPKPRIAKTQALGGFFDVIADGISAAVDAVKNVVTGGGGGGVGQGLPKSNIRPLQRRMTAPTSTRRY